MFYSKDNCIQELFEATAARSPERIALVCQNQRLTFREINQRANQLAHHLRAVGVGPEITVPIYLRRSVDLVVSILGILKTGGAWLPLDPASPKDRQAFMLKEGDVSHLVTHKDLVSELPDGKARPVLLDADWPLISKQSQSNIENIAAPTNLAYVIYTSGSSGQPKGVMVSHHSLCNYIRAIQEPLEITAEDVYLGVANFAFSASVRQMLVPLVHGATLVLATAEQISQPVALFELIKRERVSVLDIVPSYWRECIYSLASLEGQTREEMLDNSLRLLLSVSEPLLADLPRKWRQEFDDRATLMNMFGQTETTGVISVHKIPFGDFETVGTIPIGRPLRNTEILILNSQGNMAPIGTTGEIHVGGMSLSRGYLGQPELTADKFVPNPFSSNAGARLYKTGDFGRYLPDGDIEFVGRADQQVKIRGIRVELGEIEYWLNCHPKVRQAVVMPSDSDLGEKRLIAYFTLKQDQKLTLGELRDYLIQQLPVFMLPSAFIALEAFPLTPSGKVNRRALPLPDQGHPQMENIFVLPRTPVEEILARIWAEVLGLKCLGVHDNFFELGGQSLLATRVVSRLSDAFQLELNLRSLFEAPTIAGLAATIENLKNSESKNRASAITPLLPRLSHQEPKKNTEPAQVITGENGFQPKGAVRIDYPATPKTLPLVIRPRVEGIDLADWARSNYNILETILDKHGAILFRGFAVNTVNQFERFIKTVSGELLEYSYRSTPRTQVSGKIYTSTEYPANRSILLHNEMAYAPNWPLKIWFFCLTAASRGGETPIADSRKVFARLDPQIRTRLMERKVLYVRNYVKGLDLSWQTVFQTSSKSEVEQFCRKTGIEFEWFDGSRLRTRQLGPAAVRHPRTGEMVWFNQAHLYHSSNLGSGVRESMLAAFAEEELPRNAFYGDGSQIEDSVIAAIRATYDEEAVIFSWQPRDILMLDNMLTAHGRQPFVGPREVVVGMAEPFGIQEIVKEI